MSKYLLFMVLLACRCLAQAPEIQWEHKYGGSDLESSPRIIKAHGGGYLVSLWTTSSDGDISVFDGGHDFWLVRLDEGGNMLWEKTYGGAGYDFNPSVAATPDGGYIIAGTTRPVTGDDMHSDNQVIKIDGEGAIQWTRIFGGAFDDYTNDLVATPDGGCLVAGLIDTGSDIPYSSLGYDACLTRLNADGSTLWQKTYGGSNADEAKRIIAIDGGYLLGCSTSSSDRDVSGNHGTDMSDFWILNLDEDGNIQWEKCYGSSGYESLVDFCASTNGGYLLMGHGPFGATGNWTLWAAKIDHDGALLWNGDYTGTGNIEREGFTVTGIADGEFLLGGRVDVEADAPPGQRTWDQAFVMKLNSAGGTLWESIIGGPRGDSAESLLQIEDGYIMAGTYENGLEHNQEQSDLWIVKLGNETLAARGFARGEVSVSPNPATSVLNLHVPEGIKIEKTVISDMAGKKIAMQTGALQSVHIDGIAAGVYFIEIFTTQGKETLKFVKE